MLEKAVDNYLYHAKVQGLPFFYVTSDAEYISVLDELKQSGLKVIKISDFCYKDDKFPSVDDVIDSFHTADVDYKSNRYVLLGLGEYLALRGEAETLKVLRKLKNTMLGTARVVILLRYVNQQMLVIAEEDIRLKSQRLFVRTVLDTGVSIVNVKIQQEIGLVKKPGIKSLLSSFEDGKCGKLYVKSDLDLSQSILPIETVTDAYSVIKLLSIDFPFPKSLGDDDKWDKLLKDVQKHDFSFMKLFEEKHLRSDLEHDFYDKAWGLEYSNWLYFLALKYHSEKIKNPYLKLVINKTADFSEFKNVILNSIIDIPHFDKRFNDLYTARKKLVKDVQDADIAVFIRANEVDPKESIYKYTDNTISEKMAIIQWISNYGIVPEIDSIYPALSSYLREFNFDCGNVSNVLTDYFYNYKRQKVLNRVEPGFEDKARELSKTYAVLDTRANAIAEIDDKKSACLFWIDALGVEYLSYIQDLAKQKGLSFSAKIVRADLPTITVVNKGFFEEWSGGEKHKVSELDEIKHKDKGGFDYRECTAPIHLAKELDVIERAVNEAAVKLATHTCKSFIITGDHGASRLAVIGQHEEKYDTDTKGEHSGRCCKYFKDYDLENSIAENGYIVLTDYGRFKGSRSANVEVHGGSTLEEVVVPVITLSLKKQNEVLVKVLDDDKITVKKKKGITFIIYISDVEFANNVNALRGGIKYLGVSIDDTHFEFEVPDIKRSGKYNFELYDGTNLITVIEINVKGAVGSSDSGFDDLFQGGS